MSVCVCACCAVHAVNEIVRCATIHTHKRNILIVLNCKWAWAWMVMAAPSANRKVDAGKLLKRFPPKLNCLQAEAVHAERTAWILLNEKIYGRIKRLVTILVLRHISIYVQFSSIFAQKNSNAPYSHGRELKSNSPLFGMIPTKKTSIPK